LSGQAEHGFATACPDKRTDAANPAQSSRTAARAPQHVSPGVRIPVRLRRKPSKRSLGSAFLVQDLLQNCK